MNLAGKKVLITGGNGFLGKVIVKKFEEKQAIVFAPHSTQFDVRCLEDARELLVHSRAEIVINAAATVGGIAANISHPADYLYDNTLIGLQMLQAATLSHYVEKFIQIGSVCAYPNTTCIPITESYLWNGYPEMSNDGYGIAKRVTSAACDIYKRQYGLNAVSLLCANLYGPGDNFNPDSSHVIPALIRRILKAKEDGTALTIWGDGTPTRDFLYVDDCADAVVLAAENHEDPRPVNIAKGDEISITNLVDIIAAIVDFRGDIIYDATKPNGQLRRKYNNLSAKLFGFEAKTGIIRGLMNTIEWYKGTL